jgi:hypothetical protein
MIGSPHDQSKEDGMLDKDDKQIIIETVLDMLKHEIYEPLTMMFDALIFELISENSINFERLNNRLELFLENSDADFKTTMGSLILRRYTVLFERAHEDPDFFSSLQSSSDKPVSEKFPEWLQGVIEGGHSKDDDD